MPCPFVGPNKFGQGPRWFHLDEIILDQNKTFFGFLADVQYRFYANQTILDKPKNILNGPKKV